ncbi:MAG: 2OG-Fe dioxygenase family protein [Steroidobacter sp.]
MNALDSHADAAQLLRESGFTLLAPEQFAARYGLDLTELELLRGSWDELPRDTWLRDGGRYRFRRHSCFIHETSSDLLQRAPHRAHWQPTDYNALHGGMERWFDPIEASVSDAPMWGRMLRSLGAQFAAIRPVARWYIEAHQFRIDATDGIGRPTPEGAHRDGVDYVAVILINRNNVRGGETRVFDAQGSAGVRFTMTEPWTALLLDDARVIHETTPIQSDGENALRDTLVVTYREHGFQAPGGQS